MGLNATVPSPTNVLLERAKAGSQKVAPIPVRTVLLTNCIAPYSVPMLKRLRSSLSSLRILVSTPMEPDRHWRPKWDDLNVTVQRSFTLRHRKVFKEGFAETFFMHFPYDALALLYRHRPGVVISAQLGFRTLQAIAYRCFNRGTGLVIWVDGSEYTEREIGRVRTAMRRFFLRAADAVLTNGSGGANYLRRLGVSNQRIVQAPYSTEMKGFTDLPLQRSPSAQRRILCVGQLIERKAPDLLLRALIRWAEQNPGKICELWFLGDGPLRKMLEEFKVPAQMYVRFLGNVPYEEIGKYYAQSGVLVLPTLADTWGLVVNEALAAGLPVFGSVYSQAVQELVRDGENGWTFHPDRPTEMQEMLERIMSTPVSTLDEMRTAARRGVAHLTPEYTAARFAEAIRIAASASSSRQTKVAASPKPTVQGDFSENDIAPEPHL